jgi:dihydrofolate reductase
MSKPPTPTLTLILAATPSLGIGKNGGLPWPSLKKEMGYFARVTKRVPIQPEANSGRRRVNAVVMGRKTWESIPPRFRPLKDRLNVVITRTPDEFRERLAKETDGGKGGHVDGPVVSSSISDALVQISAGAGPSGDVHVERVFVIGGATIYEQALKLEQTRRVLLTKIQQEYECDTFFSEDLGKASEGEGQGTWRKASREEVAEFTGEEIKEEGVEEQGVRFDFCMYERC